LALRAQDRSVTDIAERVSMEGTPVSAQTVWAILHAEGIERLGRSHAGPAPRLDPVKAKAIAQWPAGAAYDCDHAGLFVLLPALVEFGLDTLVAGARYPGTGVLSAFHSLASLLLVKCSRRGRAANAFPLGADPGLGLALGLAAIPKATHLTSYSYRVKRSSNVALLEGLARRCRQIGLTRGRPGSTWTWTAPATTAPRSPSKSTTWPPEANGPVPCSPSSPKTTPRPRWSTPTPM
jgi:hypothetical protein